MALKVIGAGLGRTGTLSLKLALEHLGFDPCHHMSEVIINLPAQLPLWLDVMAGRPDWDAVFAGYRAALDYPACIYWRELAAYYPDAQIILTERDPESWFASTQETIFSPRMRAMTGSLPAKPFFDEIVYGRFGDRIDDRDFMIDAFDRWNAQVRAECPPERLLVFEAKQGWEPLCAFLGVPVPSVPFPRVNSRDEMIGQHGERERAGAEAAGPPTAEQMAAMLKERLAALKKAAFGAVEA